MHSPLARRLASLIAALALSSLALRAESAPTASPSATPATTASAPAAPASAVEWADDLAPALATAAQAQRKVLVLFTADWCPPCQALKRTVFTQPAFQTYAQQKLTLVKIDLTCRNKLPADQQAKNEAAAEQYGVQYMPTVLVLNSAGAVLGQVPFTGEGEAAFLAELEKL
jgi:thiol:disulfide interchange protein